MNFKHLFSGITVGLCLVTVRIPLAGCAQKSDKQSTGNTMSNDSRMKRGGGRPGGPQLGTPGGGPVIDKTGDATLQAMIKRTHGGIKLGSCTCGTVDKSSLILK